MTDTQTQTDNAPFQAEIRAELQAGPSVPDISVDAASGWLDWALVAAVVVVALWYLYRSLWAKRGQCGGCAKGKGGCGVQRSARDAGQTVVQLPIERIGRGGR